MKLSLFLLSAVLSSCGSSRTETVEFNGVRGLLDDVTVDTHAHVFPAGMEMPQGPIPDEFAHEVTDIARDMVEANVNAAFVISPGYVLVRNDPDRVVKMATLNDRVFAAASGRPESLHIFCGIPLFFESESLDEIRRCSGLGAFGIKIHPNANLVDFHDDRQVTTIASVVREAEKQGLAVLIDGSATASFDRLAAARLFDDVILPNREAKIIIAHAFTFNHMVLRTLGERLHKVEHLFVDVSAAVGCEGIDFGSFDRSEYLNSLRIFGMERVLWGSDSPICPMGSSLNALKRWTLSIEELNAVQGGNAQRLIQNGVLR